MHAITFSTSLEKNELSLFGDCIILACGKKLTDITNCVDGLVLDSLLDL